MIKLFNYKITILKKDIINKAVVLAIATVFIIGAFIPAINSQGVHLVNDQPFEKFEKKELQISDPKSKLVKIDNPAPLNLDDPWWNSDWLYRKEIIINHSYIYSNLTNFPILINLSYDDNLSANAQNSGNDIVFTDQNGNQLNHEIERYNYTDGNLITWVNVTTLHESSDIVLYMYYGNMNCSNQERITDVWDSNFMMVQHLPHNWIPYEGNPISAPGTTMQWHSVFKVNDTYYAYYHGSNQINRATSPDGKVWTDDVANNPVVPPSESGWDSTIGVPWAWYENDTYYVLYYGYNGTNAVGLATSSDGVNFTKYPNNSNPQPVISSPAEPWGVMKVNDTYYEYYVQNSYMGNRAVCIATSTDLENWTKDPNNPIFKVCVSEPDATGQFNSDAFKYGDYYYILIPRYMYGSDYAGIELYRDTSPTFYESSREFLGFVKPVSHTGGWDSTDQDTPAVLTDTIYRDSFNASNGELWMYYNGCCPRKQGLTISSSIPQALKGVMRDSTIYGNHGEGDGVGGPVPGFCKIGGGYNFDGLDEYMVIDDSSSLDLNSVFTLEIWVQLDTALMSQPNEYSGIISKKEGDLGYALWFNCSDEVLVVSVGSVNVSVNVSGFNWTLWHQIIVTYDGSAVEVYIDKAFIGSELVGGSIGVNDVDLWVGDLVDNAGNVTGGNVDEIRISDSVRDWNWINTSYNNQVSPDLFYEVKTEEIAIMPIIEDENPPNNAVNVSLSINELSFNLTDLQNDTMDYTVETSPDIGNGSGTNVLSGTYTVSVSGLDFNIIYIWYVNATDGLHPTRKIYSFTTKSGKPVITDVSPFNGAINVELNPMLQATITDHEGDTVNWYIRSNASGSWQTIGSGSLSDGNGTISASSSNMTSYNTMYWWSVNATDGPRWTNETFRFSTEDIPAPWWDSDWIYRKEIIIDHTKVTSGSQLINFPVLISLATDDDLANNSKCQTDGDDIAFTDASGSKLKHEIELFNGSNGELVAWVNVTSLSDTSDTTLYMYYGNMNCSNQENPENVWDSGFMMVQHLKDETNSTTDDSTSNGNDGLKKAAYEPIETISGMIDSAQDFDGSDDYIGVAENDGLDHSDGEGFTYTAWIKADLLSSYRAVLTHRDPGSSAIVGLWTLNNNSFHVEVYNDGRTSKASGNIGVSLSTDVWYYVGLTRTNAGAVEFWFNGTSYSVGTCIGNITPSEDLYLGRHSTSGAQSFNGVIDEARLSNIRRSDGWIATCYSNQRNPNGFYVVGSEENAPPEDTVPPEITNIDAIPNIQEANGYVNISCNVTDNIGVNVVKVNITYPDSSYHNETMMSGSYYYNTTYSQVGTYDYFIWANDTSDNSNTSATYTFNITTAPDTEPPEITNIYATPVIQAPGGDVNITCDVTDNVAVDTVMVNITLPDASYINVSMLGGSYYYNNTYTMLGTYSYFIWANDTSENANTSTVNYFNIKKLYNTYLKTSWNLISLPFNESINKTNIMVRNNSIDYNWSKAVSEGIILNFIYKWDGTTYTQNDTLESGFGYWMYAYYDCELLFLSNAIYEEYLTTLKQQKWNMIGIPYNESLVKEDLIIQNNSIDYTWQEAVDEGIILGFIYGWDRTNQIYMLYDTFDPGYGYWMYAYYECILKK